MMRSDWLKLKSGSDIRGEAIEHDGIEVQMTDEMAEAVGFVFAGFLAERLGKTPAELTIAVGRDSRLSGPRLATAVMRGLTNADCDVLDCGLCTTPAMFMTTVNDKTRCDGAIMVTASHLPWTRNGLKLITRQGGLTGAEIEDILRRAQDTHVMPRLVKRIDFLSLYSEQLKDMVRRGLDTDVALPLLGLHVVVDAGNGAGGFYEKLLRELGADTEGSQFLEPDGRFPNHIPNPEERVAMDSLSRAVVSAGADMGVIFDADCDRAAIVDATGKEINRNRLIALIAAGGASGRDVRDRFGHVQRAQDLHKRMGRSALPLQARLPQRYRRGDTPKRGGHRLPAGDRDLGPRCAARELLPGRRHVPGNAPGGGGHEAQA